MGLCLRAPRNTLDRQGDHGTCLSPWLKLYSARLDDLPEKSPGCDLARLHAKWLVMLIPASITSAQFIS